MCVDTEGGGIPFASQCHDPANLLASQRLNEDLAREYQAIIAYVVYSQLLKGAEYMNIAAELEKHARQELDHALLIARQIDDLGGMAIAEHIRGILVNEQEHH